MRRRSSSNASRRNSTIRRRSENLRFDEFGFALTKRKENKLHQRCHEYSYPQLSSVRVKELCELLSYWNGASFICKSQIMKKIVSLSRDNGLFSRDNRKIYQIERFIRMGIPPSLRGRVWKCLLTIDILRETSDFNYQKCLSEVRGPLVDLGVSEYGILSAIATLSDTQNDLGLNHQLPSSCPQPRYSVDDITLFRQIALDLQRSFPTHRSLMGESPEAIEGQAKLFRVLIAYARYSPQVGYSQGMSYIAAVLLMQLGEEEAFWALTALLDKPKYLAELFDLSLTNLLCSDPVLSKYPLLQLQLQSAGSLHVSFRNMVQHQVKVFDQFLKHRKPKLSQHLESVGVLSVHFVMPWFLTLFSSLPCWDSVLAVWDLIILHGLSAVFRTALTIMELMEPRLMELNDEAAVLPLLLRIPVDIAQYTVLIPALWNTEVQDWELKCMNSLVLDESPTGLKAGQCEKQMDTRPTHVSGGRGKENVSTPSGGQRLTEKDTVTRAKGVLTRVMHLAQQYLLDPMGRKRTEEKGYQTQTKPRHRSPAPGRVFRSRTSASLTQAQIRSRRRSQQRGGAQLPAVQGSSGDVTAASVSMTDTTGYVKTDRSEQTYNKTGTGPVGKIAHRRSNHSRVKSLRLQRNGKNQPNEVAPSSSILPSSLCSSTLPPSSTIPSSSPSSSSVLQSGDRQKQQDMTRTALIKELSSRHQSSVPLRNIRESKLI